MVVVRAPLSDSSKLTRTAFPILAGVPRLVKAAEKGTFSCGAAMPMLPRLPILAPRVARIPAFARATTRRLSVYRKQGEQSKVLRPGCCLVEK